MNEPEDELAARRAKGVEVEINDCCKLLEFDSDSPDLIRGFELGRLFTRLNGMELTFLQGCFYAINQTMIERIAEFTEYHLQIEETDNPAFISVTFTKRDPGQAG